MFVGYAKNRSEDSFSMWNVETGHVYISRDVIWLKRMFFQRIVDSSEIVDCIGPNVEEGSEAKEASEDGESINPEETQETQVPVQVPNPGAIPPSVEETDPFPFIVQEQENAIYAAGAVREAEEAKEPEPEAPAVTTRSGRTVREPDRLLETMASGISKAERSYYESLLELNCAGMDTCNKFPIDDAYEAYTIREKLMRDADLEVPDMSIYQGLEDMTLDDDYDNVYELCHLGAALGGGFENTAEL